MHWKVWRALANTWCGVYALGYVVAFPGLLIMEASDRLAEYCQRKMRQAKPLNMIIDSTFIRSEEVDDRII